MRVVKAGGYYSAAGIIRLKGITASMFVEKILKTYENVQFINPEKLLDWDVFDAAFVNALLVYGTAKQKAKTLANELLLMLAATTQINEAIKRIGVDDSLSDIVYFTVGRSEDEVVELARKVVQLAYGEEVEALPIADEDRLNKIIEFYGLSEKQIKAVQAETRYKAVKMLIMQKMASTMF